MHNPTPTSGERRRLPGGTQGCSLNQRSLSKQLATVACLAVLLLTRTISPAQTIEIVLAPAADAFVRSSAPTNNYGAAGALAVSGSAAVNALGRQNGLFDTLIRFSTSALAGSLDAALGTNAWQITGATLRLTEVGAPVNAIFNRGVGTFEVRWVAASTWLEGSGNPNAPATNGITYQNIPSILGPGAVAVLGQFTNGGSDGALSLPLALADPFLGNLLSGVDLNLYLSAASDAVGFTCNSRENPAPGSRPSLAISAVSKRPVVVASIPPDSRGQVAIRFDADANRTYQVQCSEGFPLRTNTTWITLFTTNSPGLNNPVVFLDGATNRQRFYRISVLP
jgi:hypothetical protein